MKTTSLFTTALTLVAFLAVSATAQTNPPLRTEESVKPRAMPDSVPCAKIALIDTGAFSDEKAGIKRYVHAMKSLMREFHGHSNLNYLQSRIQALTEEIGRLSDAGVAIDQKLIQTKREERERLQREFNTGRENEDANFRKRYDEVVSPVARQIQSALDQFATRHGISLILDKSKLTPAILAITSPIDVTQAFIAEFNSEHSIAAGPNSR